MRKLNSVFIISLSFVSFFILCCIYDTLSTMCVWETYIWNSDFFSSKRKEKKTLTTTFRYLPFFSVWNFRSRVPKFLRVDECACPCVLFSLSFGVPVRQEKKKLEIVVEEERCGYPHEWPSTDLLSTPKSLLHVVRYYSQPSASFLSLSLLPEAGCLYLCVYIVYISIFMIFWWWKSICVCMCVLSCRV